MPYCSFLIFASTLGLYLLNMINHKIWSLSTRNHLPIYLLIFIDFISSLLVLLQLIPTISTNDWLNMHVYVTIEITIGTHVKLYCRYHVVLIFCQTTWFSHQHDTLQKINVNYHINYKFVSI